jgi:flagellar biogenesis protein FliO
MAAKDVRNLILAIIILIIGIFVLTRIGKGFMANIKLPSTAPDIIASIEGMSTVLILGLGIIVIILIPIYLSKRSGEKKLRQSQRSQPQSQQQSQKK